MDGFRVACQYSKINRLPVPSEVLVSSDYGPYRNLAFYHVLARHGSSFYYGARLNFQAFSCVTKMAAPEGCHVGQK